VGVGVSVDVGVGVGLGLNLVWVYWLCNGRHSEVSGGAALT